MSLKEQIDGDIKKAMLSKNKDELRALRAIKSLILLAETEKGKEEKLGEAAEMQLLNKAAKQRKDSIRIYEEQGREDLVGKEKTELEIIERYLPQQLSEEELEKEIRSIIKETGAQGMQDMGKVMGMATGKLAGKADNRMIADMAKKLLTD